MQNADIFHGLGSAVAWTLLEPRPSIALESDEFEETFDGQAIGIELKDVSLKAVEHYDELSP